MLYACVCLMEPQLSTRRFRKVNYDIRTFVSVEHENGYYGIMSTAPRIAAAKRSVVRQLPITRYANYSFFHDILDSSAA